MTMKALSSQTVWAEFKVGIEAVMEGNHKNEVAGEDEK